MDQKVGLVGDDVVLTPEEDEAVRRFCEQKGLTRRRFLQYCSMMAGVLALPKSPFVAQIAASVATAPRLPVLWINGADCNGNIESFLRSPEPTITDLILHKLDLEYCELVMSGSGGNAEAALEATIAKGGYVLVVEGPVLTGANGMYCVINGQPFVQRLQRAAANAVAVIAVGTCAYDGGLARARGGVTGAVGVRTALGSTFTKPYVALPGCPSNGTNVTACIVQKITTGAWPACDSYGRPLAMYGSEIHEHCPRKVHYDRDEFVRAWGDYGHQHDWCLRYMGCQGPDTDSNCYKKNWIDNTAFPISQGAPCFGCVRGGFWDVQGGFYAHRGGD